jgi:hypothetical protein
MFEFIETQVRPTLAAISSLIVYVIAAVFVLIYLRSRLGRNPVVTTSSD